MKFILLVLPLLVQGWDKNVKYMPMGYKKEPIKCKEVEIPPQKGGSGFSVWQFLTTMAVTSNIAANIVNNVNNNNNNNNNNDNEDNQNTNNYNTNGNENSNMNMNMLTMAKSFMAADSNLFKDCALKYICNQMKNNDSLTDFESASKKLTRFDFLNYYHDSAVGATYIKRSYILQDHSKINKTENPFSH
jgi:hypothetical protein